MPESENNIQIANLGHIDWNKLKPGIKKEAVSSDLNTIWSKIDTSNDGKISQAELEVLKNDLARIIDDKKITKEEAKAYLESKNLDIEEDNFLQFMLQLGNAETSDADPSTTLNAADLGFVNGKLENVEIDARAAGISNRIYTGTVRIPTNSTMPEDGSLPKVLMMELPNDYGQNKFTKLVYNEADGTYMSRFKDMAFVLDKTEDGKVVLRAVDDEQLKMKRAENLKKWSKGIKTPDNPTPVPGPKPAPEPTPAPKPPKKEDDDLGLDNYYGNSFQRGQGDCYLLASINAIRNVEGGQKALQDLRTEKVVNGEKVYTIKLPGAILAAESLKEDNLKGGVFITGEYSFTESEVKDILAKTGSRYSKGDPDVILLEAAFEKYRKEVQQTLKANNISYSRYWSIAGMVTSENEDNCLAGGRSHDATFILTGKKSELYQKALSKDAPVLSYTALTENKALPIITSKRTVQAVNEIDGNVRRTDYALEGMLDKLEKDFAEDKKSNFIATTGFNVGNSEADSGGHAFTIKKVTADEVHLINPWYPNKTLVMSREMFMECCTHFEIEAPTEKSLWQRFKELTGLDTLFG